MAKKTNKGSETTAQGTTEVAVHAAAPEVAAEATVNKHALVESFAATLAEVEATRAEAERVRAEADARLSESLGLLYSNLGKGPYRMGGREFSIAEREAVGGRSGVSKKLDAPRYEMRFRGERKPSETIDIG